MAEESATPSPRHRANIAHLEQRLHKAAKVSTLPREPLCQPESNDFLVRVRLEQWGNSRREVPHE